MMRVRVWCCVAVGLGLLVAGSCRHDEPEQPIECETGEVAAKECCIDPSGEADPGCSMVCVSACEQASDCEFDWYVCDQGKCVPESPDDCTIS